MARKNVGAAPVPLAALQTCWAENKKEIQSNNTLLVSEQSWTQFHLFLLRMLKR
jgi:hypothetical protein